MQNILYLLEPLIVPSAVFRGSKLINNYTLLLLLIKSASFVFKYRISWLRFRLKKSNLYYTRGITQKRVTSCGLAPGQPYFEETSLWWRVVRDAVSDLTDPGIEPHFSRTDLS